MAVRWWIGVALPLLPFLAGCIIETAGGPLAGAGLAGGADAGLLGGPYGGSPSWSGPVQGPTPAPQPSSGVSTPVIERLVASPTTLTAPDQQIALTCLAIDDAGAPSYAWSATGGVLSGSAGQTVDWRSPRQPGNYAVTVLVSSASGGATTGIFDITVDASLSAQVVGSDPIDPPSPSPSPSVAPVLPANGYSDGYPPVWIDLSGYDRRRFARSR
ncbi:MAG: hypothetical protein KGR26_09270 [Cyanobacteria bacterium REEB65]|nr:hypothetical protein [Cyanobacteria bacterium REEB65]